MGGSAGRGRSSSSCRNLGKEERERKGRKEGKGGG